ncbi:MAG: nicotinamide mononucleotide transporter [Saprospiraceae bacterium]|nr:nicotinamide mononucleotide transporter [Saprospiraceae bacterium]
MDNLKFWLEWSAVGFNLMYVWYTMRQSLWSWRMGIIGVILSFWVYVNYALYSDATLQVFYGVLCLYGWWQWQQPVMSPKGYHRMSPGLIVIATGIGIIGGLSMGFFWKQFGAALPFWDGMTTSFSMIATWLTAKKYLENWMFWLVIDIVCVGIYIQRDIQPFVVLFAIYTILSVWGYRSWLRLGLVS